MGSFSPPLSLTVARPAPRLLVLAYHAITSGWSHPLALPPEAFRRQLQALRSRGYGGVTLTEAVLEPSSARRAAITFDDAFASVATAGREILGELRWPATVFVPTVAVSEGVPMRWLGGDAPAAALRPLTWDDLAALAEQGWEIGSHSRTHPLLSALADAEIEDELGGSREEIVSRLGRCDSVSYPWGELDDRVIRIAGQVGYRVGSGLVGGRARGPLAVPRFAVSSHDGAARFGVKTSGLVWLARRSGAWDALDAVRARGREPAGRKPSRPRTALVLDADSGPALAVVRSLGRAGWRVVVPAGTRSSHSRYAAAHLELADPVERPADFAAALPGLVAAESVDLVVPCTDASLELVWRDAGGARVLGGDRTTVALSLDKAECLLAAERASFPTPRWFAPATREEAQAALEQLGTPCVVKPRRSYALEHGRLVQRRHRIVRGPHELEAALDAGSEPDGTLPVLQQLVPGRSLSVSAVVQDGRVLGHVARETLSFHPVAGGTSVWKRTIPPDDAGVADALRLLREIGLEGLAEVEYQVGADGVPRLMEIGARAHGWVPLAVAAGVDLPLLAAQVALGERPEPVETYRVGVEMRWPAGELKRLAAALSSGTELPPGTTRRGVVAMLWPPWRPGMRYDGVELGDLRPWLRRAGTRRRASR
jgi:peptidoglycan/xylan/chitin deacetylase (PgdA/CDA1 family)/predicted ATP-grasp superfamily ATP-dependent carboligase